MNQKKGDSKEKSKKLSKQIERKSSTQQQQQISHFSFEKGKKMLKKFIPNQSINMIKRLVQKGADNIKKQIKTTKLLPTFTLQSIAPELLSKNILERNKKFQQMNNQLTNSMLFFQINAHEGQEEGQIIKMQTQKCYKKIPQQYFIKQLPLNFVKDILIKDKRKTQDHIYSLVDYYDEVEYNVNQQVNYKMKVFMTFVTFLNSIGTLADLSIQKIICTRIKNSMIKNLIIQRSQKVNFLRNRKQQIIDCLSILHKLKKMKKMQNKLISQMQLKGKISTGDFYLQYCNLHKEIKNYCCSRFICKFWDIAYYIERGYQDSFSRSLKHYLLQIIFLKEEKLIDILIPSKQNYISAKPILQINQLNIDESYQVEEDIELIVKQNIERQIVSIFEQGMYKCTYSTDEICEEIITLLKFNELKIYTILNLKDSKRQTTQILDQKCKNLTENQKHQIINKVNFNKYWQTLQFYCQKLQKIISRQASILNKALHRLFKIKTQFPQKFQIISSYLMQIIYLTFTFVNDSMSYMLKARTIRQNQIQNVKKISQICTNWQKYVRNFKVQQKSVWLEFQEVTKSDLNLQNSDQQKIEAHLIGKIIFIKTKLIEFMINNFHKTVTLKDLRKKLEEDSWIAIAVNSKNYYCLGQILYGSNFTKQSQKAERKMLSSSLLLQKNNNSINYGLQSIPQLKKQKESNPNIIIYNLQITQTLISINSFRFKLLHSTEAVLQFLHVYLEFINDFAFQCLQKNISEKNLINNILTKIMQFILMYNTHIKQLILNSEALKYGKIKSKSITGKHLLLCYSQLNLMKHIFQVLFSENGRFKNDEQVFKIIIDRLEKTMVEINKKFRAILQLAIKESINKIRVNPKNEIKVPTNQTYEVILALTKSHDFVLDIIMDKKQFAKFLSISWCKLYLQKINSEYVSVYKYIMKSTGSRKSQDIDWGDNIYWKMRQLEYLIQNLQQVKAYIPEFQFIELELINERKKIQK